MLHSVHRQLDYLALSPNRFEREASRIRVRHNCRPSIPLDFTMENHNSCRPAASRGQKPKVLRSADSQSAVRIWRVSNDLPGEFTIREAARWIRARIRPGIPSPTATRRYFQRKEKKRERKRKTKRKRVIYRVAQTLRNFSPTSIEHLAQKVGPLPSRHLSYRLSVQYELSSYRWRHKLYTW